MENFDHSANMRYTKRIFVIKRGRSRHGYARTDPRRNHTGWWARVSVYRHGTRQGSGDGAEAQGQHDDWGVCTCLNGACGWLRQTKPRAVSRRTRSTPRTRITRLGAVP